MSPEGRRRVVLAVLRAVGGAVTLALVGWMAWQVAALMRPAPGGALAEGRARPLRPPVLVTDGVLTNAWLARTLALPPGATLMSLDLFRLRARVLAEGQVSSATVERNPPDGLTVRIAERSPVARVMAQVGREEPRPWLVARDGVVFSGTGFEPALLATIPWLDGVRLTRRGAGFAPIAGMAAAAELIALAKLEADAMYRTWQVVSLARVESDHLIEIRTRDGVRVLFSTTGDYLRQLARLDLLVAAAKEDPLRPLREVNLALGSQVPVRFGTAAPALAFPAFTPAPPHPTL
jgi:cell division protein FtsQ